VAERSDALEPVTVDLSGEQVAQALAGPRAARPRAQSLHKDRGDRKVRPPDRAELGSSAAQPPLPELQIEFSVALAEIRRLYLHDADFIGTQFSLANDAIFEK